jgi:hypothetical protein
MRLRREMGDGAVVPIVGDASGCEEAVHFSVFYPYSYPSTGYCVTMQSRMEDAYLATSCLAGGSRFSGLSTE